MRRTRCKLSLAYARVSGVGTVVKDLFDWTDSGACGGAGDPKLSPVDESTIAPGLFLAGPQVAPQCARPTHLSLHERLLVFVVSVATRCSCLSRSAAQVVHDDAVFCFVYKYRQRFAVITDQIAVRLGLDTTKAVAKARKHHMFLDDLTCCKATCGSGSC